MGKIKKHDKILNGSAIDIPKNLNVNSGMSAGGFALMVGVNKSTISRLLKSGTVKQRDDRIFPIDNFEYLRKRFQSESIGMSKNQMAASDNLLKKIMMSLTGTATTPEPEAPEPTPYEPKKLKPENFYMIGCFDDSEFQPLVRVYVCDEKTVSLEALAENIIFEIDKKGRLEGIADTGTEELVTPLYFMQAEN